VWFSAIDQCQEWARDLFSWDRDLNSRDRDVDKFGWDDIGYPRRDVVRSQDPLKTERWKPRHLMLNYNKSLVVYHLLQCLCLVLNGLVYAAMLASIVYDWQWLHWLVWLWSYKIQNTPNVSRPIFFRPRQDWDIDKFGRDKTKTLGTRDETKMRRLYVSVSSPSLISAKRKWYMFVMHHSPYEIKSNVLCS